MTCIMTMLNQGMKETLEIDMVRDQILEGIGTFNTFIYVL